MGMAIAIDYPTVVEEKRSYNAAAFVDRKWELEIVRDKVKQAQEGERILDPLVNFWGPSGLGKSWLLNFLCDEYRYSPKISLTSSGIKPTFSLLASLRLKEAMPYLASLIIHLAGDALSQLSPFIPQKARQHLQSAQRTGNVDEFVRAVQKLSNDFVPIILLDDAEDAPKEGEKWIELEQRLIEPLVLSGRVLFVIAGRRQVPQWHRFEVRRRVEPKDTHLKIFLEPSVKEQIHNRQYNIPADLLLPYTGGSPHLVDVLGKIIQQSQRGKRPDEAWFEKNQDKLGQILHAYERYLLREIPGPLCRALKAVAPLRAYRLEALRFMLDEPDTRSDGFYMATLRELDQVTTFVWWSREHKAYITDEMVRRVINRRLLLTDRKRYEQQHQKALDMYWRWAEGYRETSEDFLIEVWFHAASLYQSHKDSPKLREELDGTLGFARENLLLDRFMILKQQIGHELRELLPEDTYHYLIKELDHIQVEKVEQ